MNSAPSHGRMMVGTKANPAKFDCYANALPDEPMFVLLARDPDAPRLTREWAERREQAIERRERPREDYAMVVEARDCAIAMEHWRRANDGKWRATKAPQADALAIAQKRVNELEAALEPFARVAAIADRLPSRLPDETPCREFFPGIWPTLGDCRKARAALPTMLKGNGDG